MSILNTTYVFLLKISKNNKHSFTRKCLHGTEQMPTIVEIRNHGSWQRNRRPPAVELNQISIHNRSVVQPERFGRLMEPPHLLLQLCQDTAHGRARLGISCIHPQASHLTPMTNHFLDPFICNTNRRQLPFDPTQP